jgi:hypothetical protein
MQVVLPRDKDGQFFLKMDAFSAKTTVDGKSLYKRIHGKKFPVAATSTTNLSFAVPYPHVKIEALEFINCEKNDCLSFEIKDDDLGTYSGTPNSTLNQFGFDVYMSGEFYEQRAQYDADLFTGMVVYIEYTNNSAAKDVYVNYVLNEVKA